LISFVGLLAPHIARLLTGNNQKGTMLLSGLAGGVLLLAADLLARTVAATELPVSIFTSLLGAPYLVWLLAGRRRRV
jgi:iron complex transport system permease protein